MRMTTKQFFKHAHKRHIHIYTQYVYILSAQSGFECANFLFENTKVGLGISRTIADSQYIPVNNVFHRIRFCTHETIRQK